MKKIREIRTVSARGLLYKSSGYKCEKCKREEKNKNDKKL